MCKSCLFFYHLVVFCLFLKYNISKIDKLVYNPQNEMIDEKKLIRSYEC